MAMSTRQKNNLLGGENGPRKVEAKIFQGPVVHRTGLREVGNRNEVQRTLSQLAIKPAELKKQPITRTSKTKKAASITATSREDKENAQKGTEVQEGEEMLNVEDTNAEQLPVAFSTCLLDVEDVDSQDAGNPQLVSEYVNDIYKHLRELEHKYQVTPRYLENQEIKGKMRAILIDWLVQVHHRFSLLQETLYLTVAILDRFLQTERSVTRGKLQLVGVTAMFIASKYEEMYTPDVGDFAYITDKSYTKAEILNMEQVMLKKLNFYISYPLPLHFLRRNSKAGSVDAAQHTLAKYLIELCLPEYCMCHYKPSFIAAAALCLSLKLLGGCPWTHTLVFYSCYTEDDLLPVISKIAAIVVKSSSSKQQAVRQKYKNQKHLKISDIPELKSHIITKLARECQV